MGLFGGNKPGEQPTTGSSKPQSTTRAALPPKQSEPTPTGATVIGTEASLSGELSSDADIVVEGRVEGKLRSVKQLIIGTKGHVKADLHAKIVSVRGTVEGNCEATGKVEITSTGAVFGNITAPSISVAEGATFRGASKMTSNKPRDASANRATKGSQGSSSSVGSSAPQRSSR